MASPLLVLLLAVASLSAWGKMVEKRPALRQPNPTNTSTCAPGYVLQWTNPMFPYPVCYQTAFPPGTRTCSCEACGPPDCSECSTVDGKCGHGWRDQCGSDGSCNHDDDCLSYCIPNTKSDFSDMIKQGGNFTVTSLEFYFVCTVSGQWIVFPDAVDGANNDDSNYLFNTGAGKGTANPFNCQWPN